MTTESQEPSKQQCAAAVACTDWLGCPFCGEQPEVTKHHKYEVWSLDHRCRIFTTMHIDWTERSTLMSRWNTRVNPNSVISTNSAAKG